jgi:hypothetical protein
MNARARALLSLVIISSGLIAHAALERMAAIERPPLKADLDTLPMVIGDWVGQDTPIDADIVERAQTDDYLNRTYENSRRSGEKLSLWINYSNTGLNLRHTPEVCLPSSGWERVEALQQQLEVTPENKLPTPVSILAYSKENSVQKLGFWYYIFGETSLHKAIRGLPITSRSSHGRHTRGSSMTIEIFRPGSDDDAEQISDFARGLITELDKIMPENRDVYFRP